MNHQSQIIGRAELHRSCAREWLAKQPDQSADFVFTDPPYPCIRREYGYMGEEMWWDLMRCVVPHCMRILKPTGSAVFILQPNSEECGRMRVWLWEFMVWVGRQWGIVQDAYWWNYAALPVGGVDRKIGLLRPSVKACVWFGAQNCYRNQDEILLNETQRNKEIRIAGRPTRKHPSGRVVAASVNCASIERGGVTPFNLWPIPNTSTKIHGAGTPDELTERWIRYACPPGGKVVDPFFGSGTTAIAALDSGRSFAGCEVMASYYDAAVECLKQRYAQV